MFCPKCNAPRPNDPVFCSECGSTLIAPAKPKKGKLWPPLVFLAVMFTIGCVIFALTYVPTDSHPSATPWFTVEDGVLSFDASLYSGSSNLVVPETVDGQAVTALSDGCFSDCDTLTSVTLPDSLIAIGSEAFANCDNLRGVKLTEQITSIGTRAFYNCAGLEAIYIPASVETIGSDAFGACTALQNVFFTGNMSQWKALYPQQINPNTRFYRVDGPDANSYSPL